MGLRCNNFGHQTEAVDRPDLGRHAEGGLVKIDTEVKAATVAAAGLGTLAALLAGATSAQADPGVPIPPPPPPALVAPVIPGPPPVPPAPPAVAAAAPIPVAPDVPAALVAGDAPVPAVADAAPPAEVPHLASPENLPPGTSMAPVGPEQSRSGSYLRELWRAVQTQEVSGRDALLLLTQRPLNANATPPPGLAANPAQPMHAAPPPPLGEPLPPAAAPLPAAVPAPGPPPIP
jgi:resuscitation-promoting factor RpfA